MRKILLSFCMMCAISGATAQFNYLIEEERSVYLQHKDEFDARFDIAKHDRFHELAHYVIRKDLAGEFQDIVERREARKLILDFMLPKDHKQRYDRKTKIEQGYSNAVDRILLLSGNDISSPAMLVIFRNMTDYGVVTTEQLEVFVNAAIGFKKTLAKNPRKDVWKQELEVIQAILNDEQLERFFIFRNGRIAMRDAQVYWQRLKDNGMTNDLDSVKAVNQSYMHILKKMKATDLYAFDNAKKREAWAAIDQYAPLPVKRIYALKRKEPAEKQGYRGTFTW